MTDRLVEILAADAARESAVGDDEDAALPVALTERHRVANGRLGLDGACRSRHDVSCDRRRASRCPQSVHHALARDGEALPGDRGRCLCVTATPERRGDRGRIDSFRPAPDDGENTLVHLHQEDERTRIRQVDDLVREIRDAVDVLGPAHGREVDVLLWRVDRLERVEQLLQQAPLRRCQRRVKVLVHEILTRAVAEAPRESVDVALRRGRIGQRARVLVNPERERGRDERRRQELPLGKYPDERRRERSVRGQDCSIRGDPVGELVLGMVVEEDLLDVGIERDGLELTQPRRARHLDDDQASDRIELEPAGLRHGTELLGMQTVEVADVPVQCRDCDDGLGVEHARGQHRPERVEVGVAVRRDDLIGPHELILAAPAARPPIRGRCGSGSRRPPCRATLRP